MTDLVSLISGGSSPFVIRSNSARPSTPYLEDTIFDGNQQPLRVKQKGILHANYGPGFASAFGAYGGQYTPISSPAVGHRHYCLGLGYDDASNIKRTPSQTGARAQVLGPGCVTVGYWTDSGIGVATDADNVWALNNCAYRPVTGNAGCAACGPKGCIPLISTIGYTAPVVYVAYLVLHNIVG